MIDALGAPAWPIEALADHFRLEARTASRRSAPCWAGSVGRSPSWDPRSSPLLDDSDGVSDRAGAARGGEDRRLIRLLELACPRHDLVHHGRGLFW
jgi:hypothetical protein